MTVELANIKNLMDLMDAGKSTLQLDASSCFEASRTVVVNFTDRVGDEVEPACPLTNDDLKLVTQKWKRDKSLINSDIRGSEAIVKLGRLFKMPFKKAGDRGLTPSSLTMHFMVPLIYGLPKPLGSEIQHDALFSNITFQPSEAEADLFLIDSLRRRVASPSKLPYLFLPSRLAEIQRLATFRNGRLCLPTSRVKDLLSDTWKLGDFHFPDRLAPIPPILVSAVKLPSGWVGVLASCSKVRLQLTLVDGWKDPSFPQEQSRESIANLANMIFGVMDMVFGECWAGKKVTKSQTLRVAYHVHRAHAVAPVLSHYHFESGQDPAGVKSLSAFSYFDMFLGSKFGAPDDNLVENTSYGYRILAIACDHRMSLGRLSFEDQVGHANRDEMNLIDWQLGELDRIIANDLLYDFFNFYRCWIDGPYAAESQKRYDGEKTSSSDSDLYSCSSSGIEHSDLESEDGSTSSVALEEFDPSSIIRTEEDLLGELPEEPEDDTVITIGAQEMVRRFRDESGKWDRAFLINGGYRLEIEKVTPIWRD